MRPKNSPRLCRWKVEERKREKEREREREREKDISLIQR